MQTDLLRHLYLLRFVLAATAVAAAHFPGPPAEAQSADPFPATYADPAVPLLQLPTDFRARRTTANMNLLAGQPVEIFNVTGAGCIRHMWFVFGEKKIEDLSIEITVDGAAEPQVRMPFRSFFGALLGFEDYHINSAGLANFPNFTIIYLDGQQGHARSCRGIRYGEDSRHAPQGRQPALDQDQQPPESRTAALGNPLRGGLKLVGIDANTHPS